MPVHLRTRGPVASSSYCFLQHPHTSERARVTYIRTSPVKDGCASDRTEIPDESIFCFACFESAGCGPCAGAPRRDRSAVALAEDRPVQPVPARAPLYAGSRPEMAGEARARRRELVHQSTALPHSTKGASKAPACWPTHRIEGVLLPMPQILGFNSNKSVVSVENASFAMCGPLAGPASGRAIKDRPGWPRPHLRSTPGRRRAPPECEASRS
jgi:hypothetical protein